MTLNEYPYRLRGRLLREVTRWAEHEGCTIDDYIAIAIQGALFDSKMEAKRTQNESETDNR